MLWQKAQHTPFIKVENSITKFHSESIKSKKLTVPWTAEAEFTSVGGKKTHTPVKPIKIHMYRTLWQHQKLVLDFCRIRLVLSTQPNSSWHSCIFLHF